MVEREEAEEHAFEVGTRLHDLEIVAPLSEGGMSAVWLAAVRGPSGETHGFRVIKCLRARVPDRQAYERMLLAEGRLAQRVDHPNVARVHGFGRHRGRRYVVMDLVQGVSLARIRSRLDVRGLRLPPSWIATLGAAYARGLHAAHRACDDEGRYLGLIHRDVSPGNLTLSVEGVPKIIDFGVAKATAVEAHSMVFKGTLRYAAPEQLRGDALDPRADLYGLGAVL